MPRSSSWRVQHIETSAGQLFVRYREGEGIPLILWPSLFFDHSLYLGLTEWLDNPMILLDGPGHGRSHDTPSSLSLASCAQAQEEILDMLGIQDVILAGTSWGGLVAILHALQSPSRVRGLILANTPFGMAVHIRLSTRLIVALTRLIPDHPLFRQGVARAFFSPQTSRRHPEVINNFLSQQETFSNEGLYTAVRSVMIDRPSLVTDIPRLKVPVLVIAGEDDKLYPLSSLKEAAAAIPDHNIEVIPATGHVSLAERPHEASSRIRKWLAARFSGNYAESARP